MCLQISDLELSFVSEGRESSFYFLAFLQTNDSPCNFDGVALFLICVTTDVVDLGIGYKKRKIIKHWIYI